LKSKYFFPLFVFFLVFSAQDRASGQPFQIRKPYPVQPQIHSLNIHYWDVDKIPSLGQKMGATVAIAPFKDTRRNRQHIGQHLTHGRTSGYFRSEPFPLEKALQDFFVAALRNSDVKALSLSAWDGKPEGLKSLKSDCVLKVLIKRFWIQTETTAGRTRVYMWVYLDILLGVKKMDKVLTQSVYVGEETISGAEFSPQTLTNYVNQTLRNVVESFFGSL
jgi:hypothetical protein